MSNAEKALFSNFSVMFNPAMNIERPVPSNLKAFATPKAVQQILRNVHSTIEGDESNANADVEVKDTVLLAEGGYNNVWLITYGLPNHRPLYSLSHLVMLLVCSVQPNHESGYQRSMPDSLNVLSCSRFEKGQRSIGWQFWH